MHLLTLSCLGYKILSVYFKTSLVKLKFEHMWPFENCYLRIRTKVVLQGDKEGQIKTGSRTSKH